MTNCLGTVSSAYGKQEGIQDQNLLSANTGIRVASPSLSLSLDSALSNTPSVVRSKRILSAIKGAYILQVECSQRMQNTVAPHVAAGSRPEAIASPISGSAQQCQGKSDTICGQTGPCVVHCQLIRLRWAHHVCSVQSWCGSSCVWFTL